MKRAYYFKTYWTSFLSFNAEGKLGHSDLRSSYRKVCLEISDNEVSIPEDELCDNLELVTKLAKAFQRLSNGCIAFKNNDFFLCAEVDGSVGTRLSRGGWETFEAIPANIVNDRQNEPLNCDFDIASIKRPRSKTIPKLIHQTYSDLSVMPPQYMELVRQTKALNQGWEHKIWTDTDIIDFFIGEFGHEILKYYLRINPRYGAARADFFRYFCIYKYGGVYLDIKSRCMRPLDEVLQTDDQYILSKWQNEEGQSYFGWGKCFELRHIPGGEFQQWFIIAAAGHPFLEAVIDASIRKICSYNETFQGVGKSAVLRVTGPIMYTLAINDVLQTAEHRIVNSQEVGLIYDAAPRAGLVGKYAEQTTPLIL